VFESLGIGGVLSFDGSKAIQGMRAASGALGSLEGGFDSMVGKVASLGSLLLGGWGLGHLIHEAVSATKDFEDMNTTLGTTFNVLAGGGHVAEAMALAKKEMREIDVLATKSPGGAQDLLGIYKQIVGPMSSAGHSLKEVRDLTLAATIAAKGLGVDYQNMGHELYKLEAGTANQHDVTFRLMKAQGLIKEEASEWNALVPVERHKKIMVIMNRYLESADQVSQTWSSMTDSMGDAFKIIARAAIGPVFERLKSAISTVLQYIFENRTKIEGWVGSIGETVGKVWDYILQFGKDFVEEFGHYIDGIKRPLVEAWDTVMESLRLVGFEWRQMATGAGVENATLGQSTAAVIGTVLQAFAQVIDYAATAWSFSTYVIGNIVYAFRVAGQRIGEAFGMVWLGLKNVFSGLYNLIVEPLQDVLIAVSNVVAAIADTKVGRIALEAAGIDAGEFSRNVKAVIDTGALESAKYDENPGFGELPESPEEAMLREEANQLGKQPAKTEVKAEINTNLNLKLDGRDVAKAQAKHQLDLKERAGANDSPWQRRQAVVNAGDFTGGGKR
jgi:hypothetical protein